MTRLLLIRHGQTAMNRQHRYHGSTDAPLNALGQQQAQRLRQRLADCAPDAVYSSPLMRAQATAQALRHAPDVQTDERLREMAFGVLEGLTYAEAQAQYPDALQAWEADRDQPPPGAERLSDVAARAADFLADVARHHPGQTALIVTHGGVISLMLCHVLGMAAERYWQFRIGNASITELSLYDAGAIVSGLNDCTHLEGLRDDG